MFGESETLLNSRIEKMLRIPVLYLRINILPGRDCNNNAMFRFIEMLSNTKQVTKNTLKSFQIKSFSKLRYGINRTQQQRWSCCVDLLIQGHVLKLLGGLSYDTLKDCIYLRVFNFKNVVLEIIPYEIRKMDKKLQQY